MGFIREKIQAFKAEQEFRRQKKVEVLKAEASRIREERLKTEELQRARELRDAEKARFKAVKKEELRQRLAPFTRIAEKAGAGFGEKTSYGSKIAKRNLLENKPKGFAGFSDDSLGKNVWTGDAKQPSWLTGEKIKHKKVN